MTTAVSISSGTHLFARMAGGDAVAGVWTQLEDPIHLELLGRAGFDYVCLDAQHGFGAGRLGRLLQVLRPTPASGIVRVAWNRPELIMSALDLGAEAVIVPMVDTAEQAAAAVAAGYYPPRGNRSWGPGWGDVDGRTDTPEQADARPRVMVMVETARGLAEAPGIAAVPGLAGIYLGPNDLALACGHGRQTYATSPRVHRMLDDVLDACLRAGIPMGLHCSSPPMARYWRDRGVQLLTVASDGALMRAAATAALRELREPEETADDPTADPVADAAADPAGATTSAETPRAGESR